jgi:hypothetical protein
MLYRFTKKTKPKPMENKKARSRWRNAKSDLPVEDGQEKETKKYFVRWAGDDPRSGWIAADYVSLDEMKLMNPDGAFEWLEFFPLFPDKNLIEWLDKELRMAKDNVDSFKSYENYIVWMSALAHVKANYAELVPTPPASVSASVKEGEKLGRENILWETIISMCKDGFYSHDSLREQLEMLYDVKRLEYPDALPTSIDQPIWLKELVDIRNKFYNNIPSTEWMDYPEIVRYIKWLINDIDNLCSRAAANLESESGLQIWNAIDGDWMGVDNLEEARKWIRENFTDPEEGIHPDIETIEIFKKVAGVAVVPIPGKNTFRIEVQPIYLYTNQDKEEVAPSEVLEMHIQNVALLDRLTDWHKGFIIQAMKEYASKCVLTYHQETMEDKSINDETVYNRAINDCIDTIKQWGGGHWKLIEPSLAAEDLEKVINKLRQPTMKPEDQKAVEILKELCQLKDHKDKIGQDQFYKKRQPELWKMANDYLNSLVTKQNQQPS